MANIQARRDKSGKLISYSVRVHRGIGADGKPLKPYTATFKVSPTERPQRRRPKSPSLRRKNLSHANKLEFLKKTFSKIVDKRQKICYIN